MALKQVSFGGFCRVRVWKPGGMITPGIRKATYQTSRKTATATYFAAAVCERTACHLPSILANTSVHTYFPLESFPLDVPFSVSLPCTTATFPNTFTSMGPNSKDSSFDAPDLTAAKSPSL